MNSRTRATIAFAALLSILPVSRVAAQDMEIMKQYLIEATERAKAWDVGMAEAIPDSALRWSPSPDMRDFAEQVVHAANISFIGNSVFGTQAPGLLSNDDALLNDKAALVAAVGDGYDWILEQFADMPASALAEEAPFFSGPLPRWRICIFALEHAMWTRGQMVPYFHAHGVAVPPNRLL